MRFLSALLLTLAIAFAPAAALADGPTGAGWEELREAPFTFWYRSGDEGIAERLAEMSSATLASIVTQTGLEAPHHVDVVLAADAQTFAQAQASEPPSWAAGTAWAERSEIYLRTRLPRRGPNRIDRVFTHEVVHIVLGRSWKEGDPPRWLNEGLSRYLAGEMRPGEHAQLARAAASGSLLSIDSFAVRWPTRAAHARLAYVQSVDFVAFLARQGDDVLPAVVQAMAGGSTLDAALIDATGRDLQSQEARWRSRITVWHALIPIMGSSGFFWGIAAVIFLFAAYKRRRAFHDKVAQMEERERLRAVAAAEAALHEGGAIGVDPTGW